MGYFPFTQAEKLVADYMRTSFAEVQELEYDEYLLLLRDAFIHHQLQTEEGRNYLDKCWTLQQTEPNRVALRGRYVNME